MQSKVSLHNHLGRNGRNPGFDRTVDIVYEALGPKGIFGIGNCNDFRYESFISQEGNYERVKIGSGNPIAIYVPEKEIMLVRGQEVFSNRGHFLVLGHSKNIGRSNLDDALHEASDNNSLIGIDHRYYLGGLGKFLEEKPDYEGYFDFDEVYNGTSEIGKWFLGPRNSNKKAIENYKKNLQGKIFQNPRNGKKHLIGAVAFGDTHQLKRLGMNIVGKSYTKLELDFMKDEEKASKVEAEEFVEDLRYGLQNSKFDNLVMKPNKIDALIHAFNMVVVNRVEKIIR